MRSATVEVSMHSPGPLGVLLKDDAGVNSIDEPFPSTAASECGLLDGRGFTSNGTIRVFFALKQRARNDWRRIT